MITFEPLFRLIIDRGMTRDELASLLDSDLPFVSRISKGNVKTTTLDRICRALHCGVDDVCRWVPDGTEVEIPKMKTGRKPQPLVLDENDNIVKPQRKEFGNKETHPKSEPQTRISEKEIPSGVQKFSLDEKRRSYDGLQDKCFAKLTEYMVRKDVSFTSLIKGTGMEFKTVMAIAGGDRVATYDEAARIIGFLGCTLPDICTYTE